MSEIVMMQPDIREGIPDGASLIALSTDDLELLEHNLTLAEKPTDKPQVFVRVKRGEARVTVFTPMQMSSYTHRVA
jgi:hypothetical protein